MLVVLVGLSMTLFIVLAMVVANILLLIALVLMWHKSATRYLTVVPDQPGTV